MIQMYHVHMSYGLGSPGLVDVSLRIEKAEFVFVKAPPGKGGLTSPFEGPFRVLSKHDRYYEVDVPSPRHKNITLERLKPACMQQLPDADASALPAPPLLRPVRPAARPVTHAPVRPSRLQVTHAPVRPSRLQVTQASTPVVRTRLGRKVIKPPWQKDYVQ